YLEEYLDAKGPPSPLSPLSDPELTKVSLKAPHTLHSDKERESDTHFSLKPKLEVECMGVSGKPYSRSEAWVPPTGPPRTHKGSVPNHEIPHHAEYYMHEAKRMKHRADAMHS
ncbi:hypothetical protein CRUP_028902, partial [Coryphaenoides rupestris]